MVWVIEVPTAHRRLDPFRKFPKVEPSNPTDAFSCTVG
jgi:hypothetical protein